MTDISAILNVHREGILAHASLLSMLAAKRTAEAHGISVEILVASDCPDIATQAYLSAAQGEDVRILELGVDNLGLARNAAVATCSGIFVAFLDGNDVWSRQWLVAAYKAATKNQRGIVWHPEANLYFGPTGQIRWLIHPEMSEAEGDWITLGLRNRWTALCFAAREIFLKVPYRPTDLKLGLGYEDWSWNAETISKGYLHQTVLGTVHLLRMKRRSLSSQAAGSLMVPTSLFRKRLGWLTNPV